MQVAAARESATATAEEQQQPLLQPQPSFSVDWITPHAHVWAEHIVPRLAGRPDVAALEIGCWEGCSALWLLRHVLTGPGSGLVCVDPFEHVHPPFARNRQVFEANLDASGERGRVRFLHMHSVAALPLLLVEALQLLPPAQPQSPSAQSQSQHLEPPAPPAAGRARATNVSAADTATPEAAAPASPSKADASAPTPPLLRAPLPQQQGQPAPQPPSQLALVPRPVFDLVYIDGSHMRADVISDAVMSWPLLKVGGLLVFDDYAWPDYADNPACHPRQAVDAFLQLYGHQLHVLSVGYQVMVQRTSAA
eukprot:XP_001696504.1 predicted protein [Chlamydomonas reinhardtii]